MQIACTGRGGHSVSLCNLHGAPYVSLRSHWITHAFHLALSLHMCSCGHTNVQQPYTCWKALGTFLESEGMQLRQRMAPRGFHAAGINAVPQFRLCYATMQSTQRSNGCNHREVPSPRTLSKQEPCAAFPTAMHFQHGATTYQAQAPQPWPLSLGHSSVPVRSATYSCTVPSWYLM